MMKKIGDLGFHIWDEHSSIFNEGDPKLMQDYQFSRFLETHDIEHFQVGERKEKYPQERLLAGA